MATMRILQSLLAAALALGLGAGAAHAQSFDDATKNIDQRLDKSLAELARVRDKIASEKVPISRSVSSLESEVLALQTKQNGLLKVRDSRTIDLTSLRRQVESMRDQEDFIDSRLDEFVRDFEGRLDIAELPQFEEITGAAKLAKKNANLDGGEKRDAQIEVVNAALARLEAQLGGQVFDGSALSADGVLTEGKFVALGPTMFFASNDGSVAGLVENQLNAADPVVVALPAGLEAGISAVAQNGSGQLPLDATLGKAIRVEQAAKGLFDYMQAGGFVGYVIVSLGVVALLLTAFKIREILSFQVAGPERVDAVLDELAKGNQEAAAWQAGQGEGISGELLQKGVQYAQESRSILEELLFEEILKVRPILERFLPFLAIAAAAAPLLGLLGTVTGMIKTFQLITVFGTGDAKSLSSGISEALVTTAMGLIVAIPTLVLHGLLSRMAKRKLGLLEQITVAFVNGVASIKSSAARGGSPAR